MKNTIAYTAIFLLAIAVSCRPDPEPGDDLTQFPYAPEAYPLVLPDHFLMFENPENNPLTKAGVKLGQHLFYDPILSADSTMSCASCHELKKGFTDGLAVSTGIDGIAGTKSSMSLLNLAFVHSGFFWDGRSANLEDQALLPVEDQIELHNNWDELEVKLRNHPQYPKMFRAAFGIDKKSEITRKLAARAIAQFERIIITPNSKYDRVKAGLEMFDDLELMGEGLFFDDDPDLPDAECNHCHSHPMMTADDFFNNGLQAGDGQLNFPDNGRGLITGNKADNGKFKAPTLRNIMLTAPYMHDGRLKTMDEVLNHYNSGGHPSLNKDPLIRPLGLTNQHLRALKAFMHTLTDTSYYSNPDLVNPFN